MEITGSLPEKGGKAKFPSLKHFHNTLIPKLDNTVAEMSTKMNNRIVVRYQHDNAPPHIEQNLIHLTEFSKRGWLIVNQPPNSRQVNVMDVYLFPSISKITSIIQGIEHGGLTLQEEELWRIVDKAFYAYDRRKLSCAFIHNEQLACAIYDEKGGNKHTKLSRGMHFNVRKCCVLFYDDEEDWEGENDIDEKGNSHVRKAIGVHMIEVLEDDLIPVTNGDRH